MKIAVDFDGTLFKKTYFPRVGEPVPNAIETCKKLIASGHDLILWTCRSHGFGLEDALIEAYAHGLVFKHINTCDNHDAYSDKIDADLFIDDKALGVPLTHEPTQTYVDWYMVEHLLEQRNWLVKVLPPSTNE